MNGAGQIDSGAACKAICRTTYYTGLATLRQSEEDISSTAEGSRRPTTGRCQGRRAFSDSASSIAFLRIGPSLCIVEG